MLFAVATHSEYDTAVAETTATGIGTLSEAANEPQCVSKRLFCRLGAPIYGRPDGRSRKARRCFSGSSNSRLGRPPPLEQGLAVQNRNWSNTMAKPLRHSSDKNSSVSRRYLSPNVIALYAEDHPPVVQVARRGRYPDCVRRLSGTPRLYVGVICELRTGLNDGVPVRLTGFDANGDAAIEAVGGRLIALANGKQSRHAICSAAWLFRTIFKEF